MINRCRIGLFFVIIVLYFYSSDCLAQDRYSFGLQFGANVNLYNSRPFRQKTNKFPGYKVFTSFVIRSSSRDGLFLFNYGATLAIYNKSLGNNFNPSYSDIQIDFTNTLAIGLGSKGESWDVRYLRTIGNSPAFNLYHKKDYAFFISTNFILNNHLRNQAVGAFNLTLKDFSVNYYNDGGPLVRDLIPFLKFRRRKWGIPGIGIADGFDRWWTGGGYITIHGYDHTIAKRIDISYDQFTGYSDLIYELSNILGINVPHYREQDTADITTTPAAFNASTYNLKVFYHENSAIDVGILGSLTTKRGRYWGFQDLIHISRKSALHPNFAVNRLVFGATNNYRVYENESF